MVKWSCGGFHKWGGYLPNHPKIWVGPWNKPSSDQGVPHGNSQTRPNPHDPIMIRGPQLQVPKEPHTTIVTMKTTVCVAMCHCVILYVTVCYFMLLQYVTMCFTIYYYRFVMVYLNPAADLLIFTLLVVVYNVAPPFAIAKLMNIAPVTMVYDRRKFRSETSDNMDSWKSRGGKSQRGEEKKWEDQRRKKRQVREKVGKLRFTAFFQWFVAPHGQKVCSLKRRVRSQLARWEMKNCTPLWREAHFQVKSVKDWRSRTTFGSWDVEKVRAAVARSTFGSQKCQKLRALSLFWRSDVEKVHTN